MLEGQIGKILSRENGFMVFFCLLWDRYLKDGGYLSYIAPIIGLAIQVQVN